MTALSIVLARFIGGLGCTTCAKSGDPLTRARERPKVAK
jgi:hypothetical protein